MFNKILVAIDRSDISKHVFNEAVCLAKATGASLLLLHVLSAEEVGSPNVPMVPVLEYYPGESPSVLEMYREQWQAFEEKGLELLRSHTNEAMVTGVRTEFTQVSGSPSHVICDLADTWGADLIVMGRRGRSGLRELILGSVSNYVVHHASCSVLIVQSPVKQEASSPQVNQAEIVN
jgi:nucleotide-binding universal stress UspA family protein